MAEATPRAAYPLFSGCRHHAPMPAPRTTSALQMLLRAYDAQLTRRRLARDEHLVRRLVRALNAAGLTIPSRPKGPGIHAWYKAARARVPNRAQFALTSPDNDDFLRRIIWEQFTKAARAYEGGCADHRLVHLTVTARNRGWKMTLAGVEAKLAKILKALKPVSLWWALAFDVGDRLTPHAHLILAVRVEDQAAANRILRAASYSGRRRRWIDHAGNSMRTGLRPIGRRRENWLLALAYAMKAFGHYQGRGMTSGDWRIALNRMRCSPTVLKRGSLGARRTRALFQHHNPGKRLLRRARRWKAAPQPVRKRGRPKVEDPGRSALQALHVNLVTWKAVAAHLRMDEKSLRSLRRKHNLP